MRNLSIKTELLRDTNNFKFSKTVKVATPNHEEWQLMTDVFYNGQRIAILNGLSSPLQWTAKNGSNIPNNIIDELENLVSDLIDKTNQLAGL